MYCGGSNENARTNRAAAMVRNVPVHSGVCSWPGERPVTAARALKRTYGVNRTTRKVLPNGVRTRSVCVSNA